MKFFIFCLLISFVFSALPGFYHQYGGKASQNVCVNGKNSVFAYDVETNGTVIKLNEIQGLADISCNVQATAILLQFEDGPDYSNFLNELNNAPEYATFVSGDKGASCFKDKPMVARVMGGAAIPQQGVVFLALNTAGYDQLFKNAQLSLKPTGTECEPTQPEWDDHICFGFNSDKSCEDSAGPFQVWANNYLTVECEDCFISLDGDIFFDVEIGDFSLKNFSTGFKDVKIEGALVFEFIAHLSWSTGVNKFYPIVSNANIFDFWIGPVPFHFYFDVPLNLQASASFDARASVEIGAKMEYDIGDFMVSWTSGKGWSSVTPTPKFEWTPVLTKPTAVFTASSSLSLVPSFVAHFDDFFTYTVDLEPVLTANAQGAGTLGQGAHMCASMSYEVSATETTELQISIPWFDVHDTNTWTHTLFDTGVKPIGKTCINITGEKDFDFTPRKQPQEIPMSRKPAAKPKPEYVSGAQKFPTSEEIKNGQPLWSHTQPKAKAEPRPLVGSDEVCVFGKVHALTYETSTNGNFIKLEDVDGVQDLVCNIDSTRTLVTFTNPQHLNSFFKQIVTYGVWDTFVTAGNKFKCHEGNMMRRILDYHILNATAMNIYTQKGHYSEVFNDASIHFGPVPGAKPCGPRVPAKQPGDNWDICLPINANNNCSAAQQPITLFSNELITITCENCFMGLTFDVFFDVDLVLSELDSFSAGFRNINIDSAIVIDFDVHADWSTDVNQVYPILSQHSVDLWIGPIPLTVSMAVPVEVQFTADFDATAEAAIGFTADWDIGDAYVYWKWDEGWKHVSPNPKLTYQPVVQAPTAQLTAGAHFALIPSWVMSLDGFYSITYDFIPQIDLDVTGNATLKEGTLCAKLWDEMELTMQSELQIKIPFFAFHWDDSWGPKTLFDTGTKLIGQKCIHA